MEKVKILAIPVKQNNVISTAKEIETEFLRKAIHILIALVPFIATYNKTLAVILLGSGSVFYTLYEYIRISGGCIAIISQITLMASRDRDMGRFVLGPVTLALGAMLALMMYPAPAASLAIYALAFGDSFASVIGKIFGKSRIPFSGGKTYAGSIACFFVVFLIAFRMTSSLKSALLLGFFTTLFEALPTGDLDNIIIPTGTGFIASLVIATL